MTTHTKAKKLIEIIDNGRSYFSKPWLTIHIPFLESQHLKRFTNTLLRYHEQGVPKIRLLPHFEEEVTPPINEIFALFAPIISTLDQQDFKNHPIHQKLVVQAIESIPFSHILALMGQRQTPASITTTEGLPIASQKLIDSCFEPFNNQISVGVRAWEKHSDRSEDTFWGTITGTPLEKQNHLKTIITQMIQSHTWWNTFHHYKHDMVYEIRVPSGHGIRWPHKDLKLIGFLEPFL